MGFWQNLADSYDKNADALKKTFPLSTTTISSKSSIIAVIVIDDEGNFKDSYKFEKENYKKNIKAESLTIPASEECLKRTSTSIVPYPVFDQYGYLKGLPDKPSKYIKKLYDHCEHVDNYIKKLKKNKKSSTHIDKWRCYKSRAEKLKPGKEMARCAMKFVAYLEQLKDFSGSNFSTDQVKAIYKYVVKETVASDLKNMKLKDQVNVVFQVEIPGYQPSKVWENEDFFHGWHQYYLGKKKKTDQWLDYITGELQPAATFHPKKIFSNAANAKLISGNDKENYTFRGKFSEPSEAVSIGYESSQKAHQFLRYLINDRGYYCGEQVILSFTIDSTKKELPPPVGDGSLSAFLQEIQTQTESDVQIVLRAETGVDFADALNKALSGFGHGKALERHTKTAVIALDSATDGRLAITFYRELDRADYLKKIADWHEGCKWNLKFWDKVNEKYVPYIGAPSVDKIIEAVHGKPRGGKDDKSYTKIKKAARERLLRCIFDGAVLPMDYVVAAVRRASNPLGITKDSKFDRNGFEQVSSTACALVRKDYQQHNKEGFKLSIELDRTDRDYLYGRLLGAADKLEEYALYKKETDRIVTAAIRHMQAFAQRPFRTWQTIHSCLNSYIQTVKGGFAFNEIQDVMQQFISGDYEKDTPLTGSYLIGYYHERAYIDSLVKKAADKKKLTVNDEQEANNDEQ